MAEVSAPGRKIKQVRGWFMYVLLFLSLLLLLRGGGRQRVSVSAFMEAISCFLL